MNIKFDDDEHRYWSEDDQEIPGVNRVMRQAGFVDESYFTDEIAERGKVVHDCVKLINEHRLNWSTVDPHVEPYVASYAAWFADQDIKVLSTEEIVFDEGLWYAGTLDFTCLLRDRHHAHHLVEVKTGYPSPWHRVQVAAYKRAKKPPRGKYWRSAILYLPSNGGPAKWIEPEHPRRDEEAFTSALNCFNWRLTHGDRTCFEDRTVEHVSSYSGR